MAKQKKFEATMPEIVDYDISHLEALDGHISDYPTSTALEKAQRPVQHPQAQATRSAENYVSALQSTERNLSGADAAVLASGAAMVGAALQPRPGNVAARQNDNAVVIAHAHNVASKPKLYIAGGFCAVSALIVVLLWSMNAQHAVLAFGVGFGVWCIAAMYILHRDRAVGLWHSATGIEHHQIDANVEIATRAIDQFAETQRLLLERRRND